MYQIYQSARIVTHFSHVITIKSSKRGKRTSETMQKEHELFRSLLPLLLPQFQVPRKAVVLPPSGVQEAPEPMKPNEAETHRTHQPSQLPALLSSALPDSPWEKVASPPPQQPQCSDMPLFMHIKANTAPFYRMLLTPVVKRDICKITATPKNTLVLVYMWFLMI